MNKSFHTMYLNGVFGTFIKSLSDYFRSEWMPRTENIVISTYDKAVETFKERQNNPKDPSFKKYPFIAIDPQMDFEPDEQSGKFFHQYPIYPEGMRLANKISGTHIYQDDNIQITPVLSRYRGTIDIIIWCSSIYELIDERFKAYQLFGGMNRIIRPRNIEGKLEIPEEILLFEQNNPYTGEKYKINWDNTDAEVILMKNINKNVICWPFTINPRLRLVGVSDGSEKYDPTDQISEHRLTISIEWEENIPTYILFTSTAYKKTYFDVLSSFDIGFKYVKALAESEFDNIHKTAPREMLTMVGKVENNYLEHQHLVFKRGYEYEFTEDDINKLNSDDIEGVIEIPLPEDEEIEHEGMVKVYTKRGELRLGNEFIMSDDLKNIKIFTVDFPVNLFQVGDDVSILIYKKEEAI